MLNSAQSLATAFGLDRYTYRTYAGISIRKDIWQVKNWTYEQCHGRLCLLMRRELRIQVAFEPTRLGEEPLHQAYDLVVPVHRHRIREKVSAANECEIKVATKQLEKKRDVS